MRPATGAADAWFTVIGVVDYLRWTVVMFSAAAVRRAIPTYDVPAASGIAIGLAMAAGVAFSVLPQLAFGLAAAGSGILG